MNYLINGDIYLKIKPDVLYEKEHEEYLSIINKIIMYVNGQTGYEIVLPEEIEEDEILSLNYIISEINDLDESTKSLISERTKRLINTIFNYILSGGDEKRICRNGNEAIIDYSGCDSFWILLTDGNYSALVQKSNPNNIKLFNNNPDNKFIRLYDYLVSSTYVGMYFRRVKPLVYRNDKDYSFVNPDYYNYLVLYANDDLFLIKELREEEYFLLERKYFKDGNYELYGHIDEEYGIERIYKEIINQLSKNKSMTL